MTWLLGEVVVQNLRETRYGGREKGHEMEREKERGKGCEKGREKGPDARREAQKRSRGVCIKVGAKEIKGYMHQGGCETVK